jgi:hypothetical protein
MGISFVNRDLPDLDIFVKSRVVSDLRMKLEIDYGHVWIARGHAVQLATSYRG